MNTCPELFIAILSMDSYNRGYGARIGGQDGLGSTSDGTIKVGDAAITKNIVDVGMAASAVDAGFYAVAHDWNGQKVISYRRTYSYSLTGSASDVSTVWPSGVESDGGGRVGRGLSKLPSHIAIHASS